MNIGDGLTIQTRTVDGKPSAGIFLISGNNASKNKRTKFNYKSKTLKYPLRSRVEPTQQPDHENQKPNRPLRDKTKLKSNAVSRSFDLNKNKPQAENPKQETVGSEVNSVPKVKKNNALDNENSNNMTKQKIRKPESLRLRPGGENARPGKKSEKEKDVTKEDAQNVNTKFVTLTQDQLNTILNLVKTKHDIDVSDVISDEKKEPSKDHSASCSDDDSKENKTDEGSDTIEPTSVPGLDLDEKPKSRSSTAKSGSRANNENNKDGKQENIKDLIKKSTKKNEDTAGLKKTRGRKASAKGKKAEEKSKEEKDSEDPKEDDKNTNEPKLSGYDLCGTLGGFGTREQNKSALENQRKQWIKELREQVERNEKLKEEQKQKRRSNSTQALRSSSEVAHNVKTGEEDNSISSGEDLPAPTRSAPSSAQVPKREPKKGEPKVIWQHRQSQENLPAAIRSSFFMGEAAPREHAFSARKKEQQKRWREELDRQRIEQRLKKEEEKKFWMKEGQAEDESAWERHFDTMQPVKKNLASSLERASVLENLTVPDAGSATPQIQQAPQNMALMPSAGSIDLMQSVSDSHMDKILAYSQTDQNSLRDSAGTSLMNNIYRGEHTTAAPGGGAANHDQHRSSYLRTMTSLLDPAQIEALEVKRRKQDEHRRAIEAQVHERRRKKEEEENRRKLLEMEEDRRLAAERDLLAQKNENEKMKHQMQENLRERQTRELYHQMQEAQESALRDKLIRREQKLRDKGHDTSRLEKTHQLTLETKRKVADGPSSLAQPSQTSITSTSSLLNVPSLALPQPPSTGHGHMDSITPRQALVTMDNTSPVSVMAQTDQGPIKLEISLSNRQNRSEVVEAGVQTDNSKFTRPQAGGNSQTRILYDSDADTEYLPLPQPKTKRAKEQRPREEKRSDKKAPRQTLQRYERDLDRQYDRYSRTDRQGPDEPSTSVPPNQRPRKREEKKPKWGVGAKNKEFIPASKRYTTTKWQQKHEANIRRREEQLLEQQALNDPERLRVVAAQMRQAEESGTARGRLSPPVPTVAHQMENTSKNPRRTRSHSPLKTGAPQEQRSRSPPVPGASRRWQKKDDHSPRQKRAVERREGNRRDRPESAISATTEQAKYRPSKHTRESPVPDTNDFVEYRRTTDVLDPNQSQSRPETVTDADRPPAQRQNHQSNTNARQDPLLNPDVVRQRDRQEQILREISILRQGLLLKQREVASYPAAMTHSMALMPQTGLSSTNLLLAGGGNLPERTNETPLM